MRFPSTLALCIMPLIAVGCGSSSKPVTMADSFDLDIFGPHVDDLHTPYVAGASFTINVNADPSVNQGGWTLSSSDPNVMAVTSGLVGGSADVLAKNPGSATLTVKDESGNVVDTHTISVAIPNRVELFAQGLLLTGATDSEAQVTEASIVEGGEATFLVRYFLDGTELYGSGALSSTATLGATSMSTSSSYATARDFLQISVPPQGMSGTVSLLIDKTSVAEVPVTAVPATQVSQVTILAQNSVGASKGAELVLYAHAIDANSGDVFGASFDWASNGTSEPSGALGGPADLFFYNFDPSVTETVTAGYERFDPSYVVHGVGGSVGSSANVGCSAGPRSTFGESGMGAALSALVALALLRAKRGRAT
jgi:hypothetical protein